MGKISDVLFSQNTPEFEAIIGRIAEDFPSGLPDIGTNLTRIEPKGYLQKRMLDITMRYNQTPDDVKGHFTKYMTTYSTVMNAFRPLMNDYDKQIVLPETCGLGFLKKASTDLDYSGTLGRNLDFTYPQKDVDALVAYYQKFLSSETPTMSFTRGKNLGWPHPIGGRHRDLADILLGTHVSLALGAKVRGDSLPDLTTWLESLHGPAFCVYAERSQRTPKTVPYFIGKQLYFSKNAAARVRGIYMSPKYMVAYNRLPVKRLLKAFLEAPQHDQNRSAIQSRVKKAIAKGWKVLAIDISKFDQNFGGDRGNQMVNALASIVKIHPQALSHEFNTPLVTFGSRGVYKVNTAKSPILMSGVSSTTLVNCFGNTLSAVSAYAFAVGVTFQEALNRMGTDYDFLAWGDDLMMMLPPSIPFKSIIEAYAKMKLVVDVESTTKFLGQNYDRGAFLGSFDVGYPFSRAIQQQFFPERAKLYPFAGVGYLARLELLGDKRAAEFHRAMAPLWNLAFPDGKFPNFPFEQRHTVMRALLPEVEKYANNIAQLDDVLNVFTHGLADTDLDLDFGLSETMAQLLGLSKADVTDPAKFVSDQGLSKEFVTSVSQLSNGKKEAYIPLLNHVAQAFNLSYTSGGLLY